VRLDALGLLFTWTRGTLVVNFMLAMTQGPNANIGFDTSHNEAVILK
jgi:hypothetical protein